MGALSFLVLPSPSPAAPWHPPHKFAEASQVSGLRFPCDLDSGLTTQTAGQADGWSLYLTLRRQESGSLKIEDISLSGPVLFFFLLSPTPTPADPYSQKTQISAKCSGQTVRGGSSSAGAETVLACAVLYSGIFGFGSSARSSVTPVPCLGVVSVLGTRINSVPFLPPTVPHLLLLVDTNQAKARVQFVR